MEFSRNKEVPVGNAWNRSKTQITIGFIFLILLFVWGIHLNAVKPALAMHLLAGVMMGYALSRSRFGFAGGIKRIYVRGEGSLTKALLLMFGLTMIVTMGIQWFSAQAGAIPNFLSTDGQNVIPGTQNVEPADLGVIVGGFLFGVGMIFSGGCASGTLTDMGEGEGRAWLTIPFFIIGSIPGELAMYGVQTSSLGKISARVYLPDVFGYVGALLVSIAGLLFIYWLVVRYEEKRKKAGTYMDPVSDWEDFEKPIGEEDIRPTAGQKMYHHLFVERWSFMKGALVVAFAWLFILVSQHKSWGVTTPFSTLSVYVLEKFGVTFTNPRLVELSDKVSGGLLQDGGTIRNLGLVAGALITFLLAGRFRFKTDFQWRDSMYFIFGGLLMGFGARFARGCNAGALYSGISTFSLSGWVFLVAMTLGGIFALKTFAGKACTLPKK